MKLVKLFASLSAIILLGACNQSDTSQVQNKEVTKEEFRVEAGKVEQHSYTEATMVWSYQEYIGDSVVLEQGTSVLQYIDNSWSYKSGDDYSLYVSGRMLNSNVSAYVDMSYAGHIVKYYVGPLKVVMEPDPEAEGLTNRREATIVFDSHGLITSYYFFIFIYIISYNDIPIKVFFCIL